MNWKDSGIGRGCLPWGHQRQFRLNNPVHWVMIVLEDEGSLVEVVVLFWVVPHQSLTQMNGSL